MRQLSDDPSAAEPVLDAAEYARRARAVAEAASAAGLDALIGYSAGNSPGPAGYLAGYEPSFGLSDVAFVVLVPGQEARRTLVTNSYWDDVERVARVDEVIVTRNHTDTLRDLLPARCDRVGVVGWDFFPARILTALAGFLPAARFEDATGIVQNVAKIKSAAEISLMRRAAEATDAGGRRFVAELSAGRSERHVQEAVDHAIIDAGADRLAFRTFIMSGARIATGIGFPGRRRLTEGEPVNVVCGAQLAGYRVELGRVAVVGTPSERDRRLMEAAADMHDAMRTVMGPGVPVGAVSRAGMESARRSGVESQVWAPLNLARDFGHGMGCWVSEPPLLRETGDDALEVGMALSVEARLSVPGIGGAVITEVVSIVPDGVERLSSLPLRL